MTTHSSQVRSLPVIKDDEVLVVRGKFKKREGRVLNVYRKKYVIHIDKLTRDKANGQPVQAGINASNVVITKLKLDKSRKAILERKNREKTSDKKKSDSDNLAGVD